MVGTLESFEKAVALDSGNPKYQAALRELQNEIK
jgi:hypothetical protein